MHHDQLKNITTGQVSKGAELGTVAVYLATGRTTNNLQLLTHRRSRGLTYGGTIATPGGAMDASDYQHRAGWAHTEEAFEHAARQAARRELNEEAGVFLSSSQMENVTVLIEPQAPADIGNTERHTNFFIWIQ
eukprot:10585684-Heterocapsa_arctica.AAC.1